MKTAELEGKASREGWRGGKVPFLIALVVLLAVTAGMFGDVLLDGGSRVLSHPRTDLRTQFVYWRDFGFGELRQGNLALWNPHIFSGAPFFGGFQSALLYPLNGVYLLLPLPQAINVGIALHVFLAGLFRLSYGDPYIHY